MFVLNIVVIESVKKLFSNLIPLCTRISQLILVDNIWNISLIHLGWWILYVSLKYLYIVYVILNIYFFVILDYNM